MGLCIPPRPHYRALALDALKGRRGYAPGSAEYEWRTAAAWTYCQMALGIPANAWRSK